MTAPGRLARARDFALIATGAASLALASIFVAGRIWFRALVLTALGREPMPIAAVFLAAAVGLGALYVLAHPDRR